MAALGWTVDESGGLAVVAVRGRLALGDTPRFRTALLKCLAEQPDALLVDLSAMELGDDVALSVFTAVARQATRWPGTPMLLCGPSPQVSRLLERGRHGKVAVYPSVEAGRRAVADGRAVVPSVSDRLFPIAGAVRHARNVATEACVSWGLPDLVAPASLVASELVSNAVEHAGTILTLQVSRRGRRVHVAVRDGSPEEPVISRAVGLAERGRGLMLVESVAVQWGWLPSQDGKVVWATLRE